MLPAQPKVRTSGRYAPAIGAMAIVICPCWDARADDPKRAPGAERGVPVIIIDAGDDLRAAVADVTAKEQLLAELDARLRAQDAEREAGAQRDPGAIAQARRSFHQAMLLADGLQQAEAVLVQELRVRHRAERYLAGLDVEAREAAERLREADRAVIALEQQELDLRGLIDELRAKAESPGSQGQREVLEQLNRLREIELPDLEHRREVAAELRELPADELAQLETDAQLACAELAKAERVWLAADRLRRRCLRNSELELARVERQRRALRRRPPYGHLVSGLEQSVDGVKARVEAAEREAEVVAPPDPAKRGPSASLTEKDEDLLRWAAENGRAAKPAVRN